MKRQAHVKDEFRTAFLCVVGIALIGQATFWVDRAAFAAEFFVAPTGNDAADGTTTAPWATLQRAADIVGPGDRVTVLPGSYTGFHLSTSGVAGAPIEFVAEPGVLINRPTR
jgi:hypothetical protein